MRLNNFTLHMGKRTLLDNVSVSFEKRKVNHILGANGCGKTSLAKACLGIIKYNGEIIDNNNTLLLGSYTNIPSFFTLGDIIHILKSKYENDYVDAIYGLLSLNTVSSAHKIKNMSDGQKQKVKLLFFLQERPEIIILDEFTNALDKKSAYSLYEFLLKYTDTNSITMINITHNLTDIEYMPGLYFYFDNQNITAVKEKDDIIAMYIRGES